MFCSLNSAPFREFAKLLAAEALWHRQNGDVDRAVNSCLIAFRLARRMGDEPTAIIGFLTQGAIFTITQSALRKVLADANASPQVYRQLFDELRAWDINRDFMRALQMERIRMAICLPDWLHRLSKAEQLMLLYEYDCGLATEVDDPQPICRGWGLAMLCYSPHRLIATNQLEVLHHFRRLITYTRKGMPPDWTAMRRLDDALE